MIDPVFCQTLARYNAWQNEALLGHCAALPPEELTAARGLFFDSIFGTWNHIAWADHVWLLRFTGQPIAREIAHPRHTLYANFAELNAGRRKLDRALLDWSATVTADWLAGEFRIHSFAYNRDIARPAWLFVTQLFQHQVHHRSQISTALRQLGVDYGVTDLPWMPGLAEQYD